MDRLHEVFEIGHKVSYKIINHYNIFLYDIKFLDSFCLYRRNVGIGLAVEASIIKIIAGVKKKLDFDTSMHILLV